MRKILPCTSVVIITTIFLNCSSLKPKLNLAPKKEYDLHKYIYSINLEKVVDDKVYVNLQCPGINQDTVVYHFPKTIPGTYKELDYGEMVTTIEPKDSKGYLLSYKKAGKNTFIIKNASDLSSINYWIDDTWDHSKAKKRIWPMAGTNIEESQNFVINAPGWFGFFEGLEYRPVQLTITRPSEMKSFSALPVMFEIGQSVTYEARDYHHLIDCPIMISRPDTSTFTVNNSKVFIEAYHENGSTGYARLIKNDIQPIMEAVANFTDVLPVEEYHFILYIKDGKPFIEKMRSKDVGIGTKIYAYRKNKSLFWGGALEHGNSSFYVLPDYGDTTFISTIKRIALHEFMHIFTPLSLHSEHIGSFNYVRPEMSKHLWLYEGVTEYFANLILLQSGMISKREFFGSRMRNKIVAAEKYPERKIPFTEMSRNVFKKKYGKHYLQVYQRGAVLGLLLDIEIIRLTNGKKTLKDIILELVDKYGATKPFDEEDFFDEFTARVHPDLRYWFADYVEGTVPLNLKDGLDQIGVLYSEKGSHQVPKRILKDYGTKTYLLSAGKYRKIKKVGSADPIGLKIGDSVNVEILDSLFFDDYGYPYEEGRKVKIGVKRDGISLSLPYNIEHKKTRYRHRLRLEKNPTQLQSKFFSVWIGNK